MTLLDQGLELMLFGMGTVIVFLSLLVLTTTAMSVLVRRYQPRELSATSPGKLKAADATIVAVIAAAIHQHRQRRR